MGSIEPAVPKADNEPCDPEKERIKLAVRMVEDGPLKAIQEACVVPAIIYCVVHEGDVVTHGSVGFGRNGSFDDSPDWESLCTLCSLSKTLVALCAGILVEEGALQWDDPVNKHVKSFDPKDDETGKVAKATVAEFLQHSSGLANPTTSFVAPQGKVIPNGEDFIHVLNQTPTTYRGKTIYNKWLYSNLAYALIVLVIEEASKTRFDEFIRKRILEPLRMDQTAVTKAQVKQCESRNFAQSFVRLNDGSWETVTHDWTDEENTPVLGMIGIRSSPKDMMTLTCALMQAYGRDGSTPGKKALGVDGWPSESFELLRDLENPLRQVPAIMNGSHYAIDCTHQAGGPEHKYEHHFPWVKVQLPCRMLSWGSWNITDQHVLGNDLQSRPDRPIAYTFGGTGICGNSAIKFFPKTRTAIVTFSTGLHAGDAAEFANLALVQGLFNLTPRLNILELVENEAKAQRCKLDQAWADLKINEDVSSFSNSDMASYVGDYEGLGIRIAIREVHGEERLNLMFNDRGDLVFPLKPYAKDKLSYWPENINRWRAEGWLDWDYWETGILNFKRQSEGEGRVNGLTWVWESKGDPTYFKKVDSVHQSSDHQKGLSKEPLKPVVDAGSWWHQLWTHWRGAVFFKIWGAT